MDCTVTRNVNLVHILVVWPVGTWDGPTPTYYTGYYQYLVTLRKKCFQYWLSTSVFANASQWNNHFRMQISAWLCQLVFEKVLQKAVTTNWSTRIKVGRLIDRFLTYMVIFSQSGIKNLQVCANAPAAGRLVIVKCRQYGVLHPLAPSSNNKTSMDVRTTSPNSVKSFLAELLCRTNRRQTRLHPSHPPAIYGRASSEPL